MRLRATLITSKYQIMNLTRISLIFLFIVGAIVMYRLGTLDNSGTTLPVKKNLADYRPLDSNHSMSITSINESLQKVNTEGRVFNKQEEIDSVLNQINPQNDWLVIMDSPQREDLLADPLSFGLKVTDQITELGIVRFSVVNSSKAMPLLSEFIEKEKLSLNHPLRQPVSPRKEEIFESLEFSDNFIAWMGGTEKRNGLGQGVKVAILDSGVDPNHPAMAGVTIQQKDFLSPLPVGSSRKLNAHGTAIASVISSYSEIYTGIAPGSEILSYRVIDESGSTDSYTVASAIVSAVHDGADVINLSLGGEEGSEVLKQAVSYSLNHGVTIVAAVGNEGAGLVNYPAAYDGVIGVSSVGSSGRVTNFSNFGEGVDLAAPGTGVLTAWESSGMANFSGTSVSAAIVTGAVAMELSRQPSLTPQEISQTLQEFSNEAEKPGFDKISGYGILSLSRLENQDNPRYADPALVGYHFEPLPNFKGGTLPFEVMVQNQGNTWLGNLLLEVNYLGINKSIPIDNLAPGELRTEKLYLQGAEIDKSVEINAQIKLPIGQDDYRLNNNKYKSLVSF